MKLETNATLEPAFGYRDLEELGEGSRWKIDRGVRDGTYPAPDYYDGRHPRWLASTVQRRRDELIAKREAAA